MATYPSISSQGAVLKTIEHFRKSFPAMVDSQTPKRLGLAPGNESYVINILRFLGLIGDDGKRSEPGTSYFYASPGDFASGMEAAIKSAYSALFEEYGPEVWDVDRDRLATWFRTTDKTTELIGQRQAQTFQTLAALGGHGEVPKPNPAAASTTTKPAPKPKIAKTPPSTVEARTPSPPAKLNSNLARLALPCALK